MDANELADALVAWAEETLPALKGAYDHDPERKSQPLPDVAAIVREERDAAADPIQGVDFATLGIEQANVHTLSASLVLAVDPSDAQAATAQLQGFVGDLAAALRSDRTLGGRVTAASPHWQATYDPPFIEFDDGTKARAATFSLAVSELI